jgi:hypothetical protein
LLYALTDRQSPYGRLTARIDAFFEGVSKTAASMEEGGALEPPDPPLTERFGDALYAFRAFVDQTPHQLRKMFGRPCPSVDSFRKACSEEYDRVFEYRLLSNLRNTSQHQSDVLHVTLGKQLGKPPRIVTDISDEVLDEAIHNTKWQARVRKELRIHSRPIDARDLLTVLRGCVQRIYFHALLSQRDEIEHALRTIGALADEVECEGELVLLTSGPPPSHIPSARLELKFTPLQLEAVKLLAKALPEGERLLWPRFAVQVSEEWLQTPAREALLAALEADPTVEAVVFSLVEGAGVFVGVTSSTPYSASTAVARAVAGSGVSVADTRIGPPTALP